MAYTRPDSTAANATWEGASAYTRPASSAADARWNTVVDIQGPGAIGATQSTTHSLAALLQGDGVLGAPAAITHSLASLLVGEGLIGAGELLARVGVSAEIVGTGLVGAPQATMHSLAAVTRLYGVLGAPSLSAHTIATQVQGAGVIGGASSKVFCFPPLAASLPSAVTHYFCKLTGAADGLPDAVLPMSSFSVRHRYDGPTYYQLTIPSYAYVSAISARPTGEIVIWSLTGGVEEELLRGDLGQVRTDRGPNSQSISLNGNSVRQPLPVKNYLITDALYVYATSDGDARLRIAPRSAIRPGDFLRYQEVNFEVGEVAWSVSVSAGGMSVTMELQNKPVTLN